MRLTTARSTGRPVARERPWNMYPHPPDTPFSWSKVIEALDLDHDAILMVQVEPDEVRSVRSTAYKTAHRRLIRVTTWYVGGWLHVQASDG